ncbi:Solute carrier family 35 member E3 [Tolypocladium capitatum]|uniref:GDP-mannose transporter n=1 Tax=Tolypocladium capitatum TaxID=45235 RepID=A0A2K3QBR4_9HYPO|nr:Solute carrier family 35 member E3 [Tolypocladium capitatum]
MAEEAGHLARAPSGASAMAEARSIGEDKDHARLVPSEEKLRLVEPPDDLEAHGQREPGEDTLVSKESKPPGSRSSLTTWLIWTAVNTLATVGIVFTNKAIFSDESLKLAQLMFAAFHFSLTWLTLYTLSRPPLAFFKPRRVSIREIAPLSVAMSLNVILPNLSLAYSSMTFYQVARILLTPCVAAMNYIIYRATLSRNAVLALVPTCVGVGMVSYYDSLPAADAKIQMTSALGVVFAIAGIVASSLYTVWVASFHRKLQISSMQLLFNQAPVSALLLLYVIPFVDTFPVWSVVPWNRWAMILMSGLFASLINISQFYIIAQGGPVSSTVVGHLKTCTIVALGWATSGRSTSDQSVIGILVALGGLIS